MIKTYQFTGHSNYSLVQSEIKELIKNVSLDKEMDFYLAVNEAVCNAAKYSVKGHKKADISICLKLDNYSMSAIISAETVYFDAYYFLQRMKTLASSKSRNLEWGDYTHDNIGGRGFFYMLQACDYVALSPDGNVVMLHSPLPIDENQKKRRKIWQLVSRLHVSAICELGVIIT